MQYKWYLQKIDCLLPKIKKNYLSVLLYVGTWYHKHNLQFFRLLIWKQQDQEVDQEIDGRMKWGRMEA